MSWSLILWLSAALLLFWSVGAYNRLMRLRSDVSRVFQELYRQMLSQVEPVQLALVEAGAAAPPDAADWVHTDAPAWSGLRGALQQFSASLQQCHAQPLDRDGMLALQAAEQVLVMSWQRLCAADPEDGVPVAPEHQQAWQLKWHQTTLSRAAFAGAVTRYNEAIGQFPASLLAWIFGFHAAAAP